MELFLFDFFQQKILLLLSASVERFGVSLIRDFLFKHLEPKFESARKKKLNQLYTNKQKSRPNSG